MNTSDMPKNAKFFNSIMGKMKADAATKAESDAIAAATKCDESLVAHPDIGSKEKLTEMTELFKRAMTNHVGLSADEVTELGDGLALSTITSNPVLQRIMLKTFAPLAGEAQSEGGGSPSKEKGKPKSPHVGTPTGIALKWK